MARACIQHHARAIYFAAIEKPKCLVCGYTAHVEVAHRIPVFKFPGDARVGEINALTNLMGLCPNHHWEFDNGHPVIVNGPTMVVKALETRLGEGESNP